MEYKGAWDDQKAYSVGDYVGHSGSLWHCLDANCGVRPGSSATVWLLLFTRDDEVADEYKRQRAEQ